MKTYKFIAIYTSALMVAILIVNNIFFVSNVKGNSMYPTIKNEDILLVDKIKYKFSDPKRNDIIVFESDLIDKKTNTKKLLVKRIIGLPGEKIEILDGNVYVNGNKIYEDYINKDSEKKEHIDVIVPEDEYFVLGDNRLTSRDSRDLNVGTIQFKYILGEVKLKVSLF